MEDSKPPDELIKHMTDASVRAADHASACGVVAGAALVHMALMAMKPIGIWLDPDTIARVDTLVRQVSTEARAARRSDILRTLIHKTLESMERELGISPPPRQGARRRRRPDREG